MVNFIECFYVNGEPESKFLYTETIKLYCIMMFLVQFLFVALKLKDSRVLEKEIRRKHANVREHKVKMMEQI